ncbi:hypothetical protein GCM10017744_042660 [Streptomyces antimycoticus]
MGEGPLGAWFGGRVDGHGERRGLFGLLEDDGRAARVGARIPYRQQQGAVPGPYGQPPRSPCGQTHGQYASETATLMRWPGGKA